MDRIALIGHSRGGEAVAHAAAFNRLPCLPDDCAVRFDFHFAIRALVAIAPIDGGYLPADQPVPIENVSYLVLHGSHDGDVRAEGPTVQRVKLDDGLYRSRRPLHPPGDQPLQHRVATRNPCSRASRCGRSCSAARHSAASRRSSSAAPQAR
jgi:pimeloyl-ACP methyl ester carboxylesterase